MMEFKPIKDFAPDLEDRLNEEICQNSPEVQDPTEPDFLDELNKSNLLGQLQHRNKEERKEGKSTIPSSNDQSRLRETFLKNKHITDCLVQMLKFIARNPNTSFFRILPLAAEKVKKCRQNIEENKEVVHESFEVDLF